MLGHVRIRGVFLLAGPRNSGRFALLRTESGVESCQTIMPVRFRSNLGIARHGCVFAFDEMFATGR
jgi:hypothetical protein